MKGKVFGELFWTFLIGFFVVGIAAVFIVGYVRGVFTDIEDNSPNIAPPPAVAYVEQIELPTHLA